MWKEEGDDKEFLEQLFSRTLALAGEHDTAIEEAASNWDLERIATMDLLLLRMALAEARTFESVPLKVTMNEYIDLAKFYSTEKSSAFVNGVLDKLFSAERRRTHRQDRKGPDRMMSRPRLMLTSALLFLQGAVLIGCGGRQTDGVDASFIHLPGEGKRKMRHGCNGPPPSWTSGWWLPENPAS